VDFYVLGKGTYSAAQLACHLALKALEQGHRIAVLTESQDQAKDLDELMWNYPSGRFLPHSADAGDSRAPVSIATANEAIPNGSEVVINLTTEVVPEPARFRRLLEIVPGEPSHRTASRQKYRSYREQGLSPNHHPMGSS